MPDLAIVQALHPEHRLEELESVIARSIRGFKECGEALAEIKDRGLYRQTHRSWDAYCVQKWGLTGRAAYRKIEQAKDAKVHGVLRPQREIAEERRALARGETPRPKPGPVPIIAKSHPKDPAYCGPRAVVVIGDAPTPEQEPDLSALAADLLADIEALVPEEPERQFVSPEALAALIAQAEPLNLAPPAPVHPEVPVIPLVPAGPEAVVDVPDEPLTAADIVALALSIPSSEIAAVMTADRWAAWDEWVQGIEQAVPLDWL